MNLTLRKKNGDVPSIFSDWFDSSALFNPLFRDFEDMLLPQKIGVTVPSANIREREKDYAVELAAPGFERGDFRVELENRLLTIQAEKKEEKTENKEEYSRREFYFNSFVRSFQLPENIVDEQVDAKYDNGILTILIPKKDIKAPKAKKQISVA